ncbi:MAG: phenylacetate--CoA ligase family protein [Rubripirellula sp.]
MRRDEFRVCSEEQLKLLQLQRLNQLLEVAKQRPFYAERLAGIELPLASLSKLTDLPLLTKSDLVGESRGHAARIFELDPRHYSRFHQTSGTKGWPLPVLDTDSDWTWWLDCWDYVLDAAGMTESDIALMAFSFGPFIGFWTANDAIVRRGALVIPGGGISTENRLRMLIDHQCTIVCCTPTYAMHLANVAEKTGVDLPSSSVKKIIVAGEPGGSIASVRERIESAWGASVIDHTGASELGAWGFGSADGRGIHVIESQFIAELLIFDEQNPLGRAAEDGQEAELVLTNLGRLGGPAIRYRTGDVVRGYRNHDQPCRFLWLEGGVLGRADDMLVIRGVNVFPSSVEAVVREVAPKAEFRMIASRRDEMDQLAIEVEAAEAVAGQLSELLRERLAMRVAVTAVPQDSLPRFEAKAKRLVDRRHLAD